MKTQYTAFYVAPAYGEPFTVTEHFRMVQLRHITAECSARVICHSLQTVAIQDHHAAELVRMWNQQARGRIVYKVVEDAENI